MVFKKTTVLSRKLPIEKVHQARIVWITRREEGRFVWIETDIFRVCGFSEGFSGRNKVDVPLQENVPIPCVWIEHIQHVGSSVSFQSYWSIRSDCWRQRCERRAMNRILHSGCHERNTRGRTNFTTWKSLARYFLELLGMRTRKQFFWAQSEKCSKQRIDIRANEFQCHHPQQQCASQLFWKSGKSRNRRNSEAMDSSSPRLPQKSLAKVFGKFDARAQGNMLQTKWRQDPKSVLDAKVFHAKNLNNTRKIIGNKTLEDLWMQLCLIQTTDTFIDCWIAK